MYDEIAELGGPVDLHRLAGHVATGGHHMAVFEPAEEIHCIIRPYEEDVGEQLEGGYSGQTPGYKIYVSDGTDLDRDDRLAYRGDGLRLSNPQYDQLFDLQRWDGREDERQFRLTTEVAAGVDIIPPEDDL